MTAGKLNTVFVAVVSIVIIMIDIFQWPMRVLTQLETVIASYAVILTDSIRSKSSQLHEYLKTLSMYVVNLGRLFMLDIQHFILTGANYTAASEPVQYEIK